MPRLKSETIGTGDQRWLGSRRGVEHARSGPIDVSSLTENTHYPNGYVVSGQPVAIVDDLCVPWDGEESDGSEILAGFVVTDVPVASTDDFVNVPVLRAGDIEVGVLIDLDLLPSDFDPTTVETTGSFTWAGVPAGGS